MAQSFHIPTPRGERRIGAGEPCFIVAEMSANHGQNYDTAAAIVRAAAAAGADAIKLQSYLPESLTIDCDKDYFVVGGKDNPDSWQKETFFRLYQKAFTPREWHADLQRLAESLGLVFFSTPYAPADVDFLATLKVPMYKIASYEATDITLLRYLGETGKPVIMSVGFATLEEIEYSVKTIRDAGCKDLALLHCVTSYTDNPNVAASNLRTMLDMRERWRCVVGFSDNNGGIEVPVVAAAMGASILEKHFVLESTDETFDARFSLSADDFKKMVQRIRAQEAIMGKVHYGPQTEQEGYNRRFRRSLFAIQNIKRGEKFTAQNVRSIRPADGLETRYYDRVLGKTAAQDIERGTPLSFDHLLG